MLATEKPLSPALIFLVFNSESIIQNGGFALIAVLVFVETGLLIGFLVPGGESLLVTAGLLAGSQTLKVPIEILIPTLVIAAVAGDITGYYLGKKMGSSLYEKPDSFYFKKKYLYKAEKFYRKHGNLALILGRFVPFVRTFNPFISGATNLSLAKFLGLSIISSILWVGSLVGISYWLGRQFPQIKNYTEIIIPAIIALALIPLVRTIILERRKAGTQH